MVLQNRKQELAVHISYARCQCLTVQTAGTYIPSQVMGIVIGVRIKVFRGDVMCRSVVCRRKRIDAWKQSWMGLKADEKHLDRERSEVIV